VFLETAVIKVPVSGGAPIILATITDRPAGGSWRAGGTIAFATSEGLYEVSANGGERKVIAKPERSRKETPGPMYDVAPGGRF
jgi:hypothetical protein